MAQKNSCSIFVFCFVLVTLDVASAQRCSDTGFFRRNSTFDSNRSLLLSSLASNVTAHGGFANASIGHNPDRVYAMGMCVPGVEPATCTDCIQTRSEKMIQNCPNQTEAFDWDGNDQTFCQLRYSNRSFFGSLSTDPIRAGSNSADIDPSMTEFNKIWEDFMVRMIDTASSDRSSSSYYAADTEAVARFQTIYAVMQCTMDISTGDCNYCLQQSVAAYQSCCRGKQGGFVSRPSCFFRWDLYPFHGVFRNLPPREPQLPASPAPRPSGDRSDTAKKDGKTISKETIVAIVVPVVIVLLIPLALRFALSWRIKSYREIETESEADTSSSLKFDFINVLAATNHFSEENKLGEGGFGSVYKGTLANGQEVAVKRLSKNAGQGQQEFKNEVLLLSGLQHKNLVKLLGYCWEEDERLLIYEFLPNSSLDHLIFDSMKRLETTWNIRYNIIGCIARGLLYLHEDSRLKIIHRDLKPNNILLEKDMNAKIADFGLAKLFTIDESQALTNKVMGTIGYMATEYIMHGQVSVKSDVYSFGITVLEIISGQKNNNFQPNGLPCYAWMKWHEHQEEDIIDPLMRHGSRSEIMRCIHIGLLCVQEDVTRRPTMNSIVLWLSSSSVSMPVPTTPAFFIRNTSEPFRSESSSLSKSRGENCEFSVDKASITELEAR